MGQFYELDPGSACSNGTDSFPSKPERPHHFNELPYANAPSHDLIPSLILDSPAALTTDFGMDSHRLEALVQIALDEDGTDITTESIFGPDETGTARLIAKADGVLAGMPFASAVFRFLDPRSRVDPLIEEGGTVKPGTRVATVTATVRALLTGERTALNLLQRASGIATMTRRYVEAVSGTGARILDTRKTAPGLRLLDKYAVRTGGGMNHRMGLDDMFLVKDNHVDRAGGIARAAARIREAGIDRPLMIEVRNLEELDQAIDVAPQFILLDNMDPADLRIAVARLRERQAREDPSAAGIELEASGGITLEGVGEIARTGVDRISIGALTHSVTALDISMLMD